MKNYYSAKSATVQAFQMTRARRTDNSQWPQWLHEAWNKKDGEMGALLNQIAGSSDGPLVIETREGRMKVDWQDFIVRNAKGDLYPSKPGIFADTYEELSRPKLDAGQKQTLRLIGRDKEADGWTAISSQVYEFLSEKTPTELAVFEPVGNGGRAQLTPEGQRILDAMEWL